MASRCTTALVDPPSAARATIALRNDAAVSTWLGRRSACTISTASFPVPWAWASSRLSGAGSPAVPGRVVPSTSASSPMVEAVPITLQCPRLRIIDDSAAMKSAWDSSGPYVLAQPPHVGAAAERLAAERAGQHGPAGDDHRGQVHRRRPHEQRGDGLVAPAQQHHAVDRVGPDHLLDGHGGHVPPQHRGRADVGFAQRHHRHLQRNSTRLPHPGRDVLGHLGQVPVARHQVGRGVGDGDRGRPVNAESGSPRRIQARWRKPSLSLPPYQLLLRRSVIVSLLPAFRSTMRNAMDVTPAPEPRIR